MRRWYLAATPVIVGILTIYCQQQMFSLRLNYHSIISSTCKKFSAIVKQVQPNVLKKVMMSDKTASLKMEIENAALESEGNGGSIPEDMKSNANSASINGDLVMTSKDVEAQSGETSSPPDKRKRGVKSDKPRRTIPNAFVSLPITNVETKQRMIEIQQHMIDLDKSIEPLRISQAKFHLTLMVINLDEETQSSDAQEALEEAAQAVSPDLSSVSFQLDRLSTFGKRVVFMTFSCEQATAAFKNAASKVREIFKRRGLPSTDSRPASPHVTLFKVDGKRRKGHKPPNISIELHEQVTDTNCGNEVFNTLQLCSMTKPKTSDGYYHILHETSLNEESTDVHSDELPVA